MSGERFKDHWSSGFKANLTRHVIVTDVVAPAKLVSHTIPRYVNHYKVETFHTYRFYVDFILRNETSWFN